MKIKVGNLRQNPFRNLERYPRNRTKIDALKQSIHTTGFWDNLLARPMPDAINIYEIAYGHHRLIALQELGIEEVDIPVRDLSNELMAKIMANDNIDEYGSDSLIEQETVRSIVEAFANNRLQLEFVRGGRIYQAPSFQPLENGVNKTGPLYTVSSLVKFLGWTESKTDSVLQALATIEKGLVKEEQFTGLTTYQAGVVASQVQRIEKDNPKNPEYAKSVGHHLSSVMRVDRNRGSIPPSERKEVINTKSARFVADSFVRELKRQKGAADQRKRKELPSIDSFIATLTQYLFDLPAPALKGKLDAVITHREAAHPKERERLIGALETVAKRFMDAANKLRDVTTQNNEESEQRRITKHN